MVRRMYDELSDGQLKWQKLDYVYDVMHNAKTGERIEVTDDHELNRKVLTAHFDVTSKSWSLYDRKKFWAKFWCIVVLQLKLWNPIMLRLLWPVFVLPYRHFALRPATEVLTECGFSSEVIGALTYHYGDHGVPPHRCPFFMTALLDRWVAMIHVVQILHYSFHLSYSCASVFTTATIKMEATSQKVVQDP